MDDCAAGVNGAPQPKAVLAENRDAFTDALSSRAVRMLNAWLKARDGDLVPSRQSFDPMSVPSLLPCISLYRWDAARGDFVCKLAGEALRHAWGRSIAGLTLTEIVGTTFSADIAERWRQVLDGPNLQHGLVRTGPENAVERADRLVLPLKDGRDGPVDHILILTFYRFDKQSGSLAPLVPRSVTQIRCAEFEGIQSV